MNIMTGEASDAFFGGEVPQAVRDLLHEAAVLQGARAVERRPALLWTAQAIAPTCLAVYYALYKHHAGRREFDLAERAARRGLIEAERLAGIDADGLPVAMPGNASPAPVDFMQVGPARFWLFTRKALAFICLRTGRPEEAREHLAVIAARGAGARLGDEVVSLMLDAATSARTASNGSGPADPAGGAQAPDVTP
jgi:hypothetical protein